MLDAWCLMLYAQCLMLMLDAWCSMIDAGCWMLDARCLMLDTQCWMLDAECSMLNARCSMLDARCWMLDAEFSILNAGCPIICYFQFKSILIMFLHQQRNWPRRAQCNKSQHAPNAINRNASTTFDSFLRHLYFPLYQDTFILRQQFVRERTETTVIIGAHLFIVLPSFFGAQYMSLSINPTGLSEHQKTFSRHWLAFWFLSKALNSFLILFQGIE